MEMPGPMEAMEAMEAIEAMSLVNAGPGVFNGTRPSSRSKQVDINKSGRKNNT
jgi:hypothetical protein